MPATSAAVRPLVAYLTAWVALSVQAFMLVLALVLFGRWLDGALKQPLPGPAILGIGLALAAWLVVFRIFLSRQWSAAFGAVDAPRAKAAHIALFVAPGLTSVLVLVALGAAHSSIAALALAWVIIVAADIATWRWLFPRHRRMAGDRLPSAAAASDEQITEASGLSPDVCQQLTRTRTAEGETLSATLRIDFAADDRVQVAHLAFCPPFAAAPQLEMEQQEGAEVELRATSVQAFGARIEARLAEASDEPQSAVVQIYAATATGE